MAMANHVGNGVAYGLQGDQWPGLGSPLRPLRASASNEWWEL